MPRNSNFVDFIRRGILSWQKISQAILKVAKLFLQPKYDGYDMKKTIKECLGNEPRISETITNVIIPTVDIKRFQPTIFSTLKVFSNNFISVFLTY
jgi:hypothetical protein